MNIFATVKQPHENVRELLHRVVINLFIQIKCFNLGENIYIVLTAYFSHSFATIISP